jgi:hypothetical protein
MKITVRTRALDIQMSTQRVHVLARAIMILFTNVTYPRSIKYKKVCAISCIYLFVLLSVFF